MRGFVVVFDCPRASPTPRDTALGERLVRWEQSFAPNCLRRYDDAGARFYLFTSNAAIPAEFNQNVAVAAEGIRLWIGPRIDLTDADLLTAPPATDFDQLANSITDLPA